MQPYKILVTPFVLVVLALFCSLLVPRAIRHNVFTLQPAPLYTGRIAQALGQNEDGLLPIFGTDFTTVDTRQFGSDWIIMRVSSGDMNDTALVVLKKTGEDFDVVMGPGTAFSRSNTVSMPIDLAQYLDREGYLYDAI